MLDTNALGERGEHMFYVAISRFHGDGPLFRPVMLGGKWPVADLAVELVDDPGMFFLVQVKTTQLGYLPNGQRLLIRAKRDDLQRLADVPLPTYLIGVDEPRQKVFLTSVYGTVSAGKSGMTVAHSVDSADVRTALYAEVKRFWQTVRDVRPWSQSQFADQSEEDSHANS